MLFVILKQMMKIRPTNSEDVEKIKEFEEKKQRWKMLYVMTMKVSEKFDLYQS